MQTAFSFICFAQLKSYHTFHSTHTDLHIQSTTALFFWINSYAINPFEFTAELLQWAYQYLTKFVYCSGSPEYLQYIQSHTWPFWEQIEYTGMFSMCWTQPLSTMYYCLFVWSCKWKLKRGTALSFQMKENY